jgi:hypothetical protein
MGLVGRSVGMRSFLALMLLLVGLAIARLFLGAFAPDLTLSSSVAARSERQQQTTAAVDREPAPAASALARKPVSTAAREVALDWGGGAPADAAVSQVHVSAATLSCQQAWEPSTHMTQDEWTATCQRVEARGEAKAARW